ncbi:uncharacterized protein LOC113344001 [Papaver somniferum]|uniref:uncharacterized protein LOC113344001 n=1 Tax=Papaver somniferum TaxID=3469 RepID=UPI000E6F89E4|nr:uncharacterized protein LOC113344001 [Papaver somniferum]
MTLKDLETKTSANEAAISKLQSDLKTLSTNLSTQIDTVKASFRETLQENNRSLIQLLHKPANHNRSEDPEGSHQQDDDCTNYSHHHSSFPNHHHRIPKLDFPRFDGYNPRGWIQKSERYFKLSDIEEHRKVDIAAIYLEVKAEKWFLNFQVNRNRITCQDLSLHLCARFENPVEENFVGSFNKLVQSSSVDDYYDEFESLKALTLRMNPSLSESYFVMSFLSGLKDDIGKIVSMFHPKTLADAFSLARLQEQKLQLTNAASKPFTKSFNIHYISQKPYTPNPLPPKPIITSPKFSPSTPKSFSHLHQSPPLHLLSLKDSLKRTWTKEELKGAIIIVMQYSSLATFVRDTEEEEEVFVEAPESPVQSEVEVSLHALTGSATGDTIRIPGLINKKTVFILIDTGSTTSFIDSALVTSLKYSITPTSPMLVTVANGEQTTSSGICSKLQWSMQGHHFMENLRVLPLGGCDIVLGADWLKKLGDVTFNFAKLSASFLYKTKLITLQGTTPKHSFLMMSGEAVKNLFLKHSHGVVAQLFSIHTTSTPPTTPAILLPLLQEYTDIFQEPSTLPPERSLDHKIPLQPNSSPVNQRAYNCPYVQKRVVEQLVKEMLQTGIIQPSHNPFSSPKLLVRKKDNSWRFCVDYRKLNNITIKDKFSIPIVDELLDELHGAIFFSKIDLREGYHQIRVHDLDIHKTAF